MDLRKKGGVLESSRQAEQLLFRDFFRPGPRKRSKSQKTKKIEKIRTFSKLPPTKIFYLRFKLKINKAVSITDPRRNFWR